MAEEFKIEIPIEMTGKSSDKGTEELNKSIKKLDKTVYGTLDVIEMLSSLLGDVYKIIQPLFKILSLLFMIFFLPFIPIIKKLVELVGNLIKWIFESGAIKSMMEFAEKYAELLGQVWTLIAKVIVEIIQGVAQIVIWIVKAFIGVIEKIWEGAVFIWEGLKWIWEKLSESWNLIVSGLAWVWNSLLLPVWNWLSGMFMTIWENFIKPPFMWLASVGKWIWEQILQPAFNFLKDVGSWIWNILKKPFEWLADTIKSVRSWFSSSSESTKVTDAIIQPNGHVIQTSPKDYLIATKDPKSLGGGSSTININNPIVREEKDIKKIADEVSKILERKLWRSY